jgi:hypothetical protein
MTVVNHYYLAGDGKPRLASVDDKRVGDEVYDFVVPREDDGAGIPPSRRQFRRNVALTVKVVIPEAPDRDADGVPDPNGLNGGYVVRLLSYKDDTYTFHRNAPLVNGLLADTDIYPTGHYLYDANIPATDTGTDLFVMLTLCRVELDGDGRVLRRVVATRNLTVANPA